MEHRGDILGPAGLGVSALGADAVGPYPRAVAIPERIAPASLRTLRMEAPDDPRVVLVTAPDDEVAARLARSLVAARLAACVNRIGGVRSTFTWEGEVVDETEVLMIVKSTVGRLAALERAVAAEHPYDTPEFVVLDPAHVAQPYLAWLRASVAEDEGA